VKHTTLLYKLATCFDPYRVIIRPSYSIVSLKRSVRSVLIKIKSKHTHIMLKTSFSKFVTFMR